MSETHDKLIKAIVHYQQNLERYSAKNEETKMLHCIDRLQSLPIRVPHLEETGVGRTVNSIRKIGGTVGDAARLLVNRWKNMVQEEATDSVENQDNEELTETSVKEKHRHSSSHNEKSASTSQNVKDKYTEKEKEQSSRYAKERVHEEEESEDSGESRKKHRDREKKSRERRRSDDEQVATEETRSKSKDRSHKSSGHHSRRSESAAKEEDKNHKSDNKHKSGSRYSKNDNKNHRSESKRRNKDRGEQSKSSRSEERHKSEDKYLRKEEDEKEERRIKETHGKSSRKEKKRRHQSTDEEEEDDDRESKSRHKESETSMHKSKRKHISSSEEEEEEEQEVAVETHFSSNNNSENDSSPTKYLEDDDSCEKSLEVKTKIKYGMQSDDSDVKHSHSSRERKHKKSKHSNGDSESSKRKGKEKESKSNQQGTKSEDKSEKSKSSSSKSKNGKSSESKKKRVLMDDGIDCGSGASFAEALGMLVPSSSKASPKKLPTLPTNFQSKPIRNEPPLLSNTIKLEPLDLNISCLLPTISTNYKPLGNSFLEIPNAKSKPIFDDEALTKLMYAKNQRTKVYSGNKTIWGRIPSLFEICTRILQDNIDALEYTGGVPYSILKPVLEKATPDQLFTLEHHNPYLIEDTDELWLLHCNKEFRTKPREELESWREMYMRCLDEREAKLRALTANIKLSQDKSLPVRQTKLAYVDSVVKPPRNIARKQAKNGFDKKPFVTPSSRLSALALSGGASQIAVPNPGRAASSSGGSGPMKPKKAPLMQKTLQLMKGRFRR